jgi:enoyl-CoA hydratase/carnithine racemase
MMQLEIAAPLLRVERLGRVLTVTMSRAPVNALNDELIAQLDAAADLAIADDGISVLHIRSDQRAFSAGADLALIRACFATPEGPDAMTAVVRDMQRLYEKLEAAPLVTLAEIGATALGGGLELALACDLRVAAREVRLGLPEAGLGLLPGAGGTQRLTRLVGPGVTKRMILGAEIVSGEEAERIGIVQWSRPLDELAAWTAALATRYAAMPKSALAANAASPPRPIARDGYAEEISETRTLYDHPTRRGGHLPGARWRLLGQAHESESIATHQGAIMTFKDKVVVVTGAASGIGRATAQKFAEEGARVVVADVDAARGEEAAAAIRAQGGRADFMPIDMTNTASIDAFGAAVQAKFGAVDVLVNGAGWGRTAPFGRAPPISGTSSSRSTSSARCN